MMEDDIPSLQLVPTTSCLLEIWKFFRFDFNFFGVIQMDFFLKLGKLLVDNFRMGFNRTEALMLKAKYKKKIVESREFVS